MIKHRTRLCHSFLYDGDRITEDDTPASLDMEDNGESPSLSTSPSLMIVFIADTIDVMVERESSHIHDTMHCINTIVSEVGGGREAW